MSKNTRPTRAQVKAARSLIADYERSSKAKGKTSGKVKVGVNAAGRKYDLATGKLLPGKPVKGTRKVTQTRGKVRKTATGTSQRIRTAPKKGQTLALTQDSRLAFLEAAKKDGFDLRAKGVVSTRQIVVAAVLGKKGLPKGYAPKGFVIGERYTALANGYTKAEVKALLNRA